MSPDTKTALETFDLLRHLTICEEDEWLEVRAHPENGSPLPARYKFIAHDEPLPVDLITTWIEQGYSVHFGPLPRQSPRGSGKNGCGTDKDVLHSRVLFQDFDLGEVMGDDVRAARLHVLDCIDSAGLPIPTVLVASGNGFHAYWVLNTKIDVETFRDLQLKLSRKLDADSGVKVPSRIMRLFGSFNRKAKTPDVRRFVQPFDFDPSRVYSPSQFRRTSNKNSEEELPLRGRLSPRTVEYLNNGQHTPQGMRKNELFAAACDMAGNRYRFPLALEELRKPARGSGLGDETIEQQVKSAFSREREPSLKDIPIYDNDAGLPVIWTGKNKPIHVQSDPAMKALADAGDIYVMGTKLVRIRDDGRGGKISEEMSRDAMRGVLDRLIYWAIAVRTKHEN